LKEQQTQIGQAKVMEQNRISRELHDGVMNKLYGVRLQLGIHNESNADAIKEKRLGYIDLLQDIEKEIRIISHDLHTAHFEYLSLLTDFIHQQNEFGTTQFTFDCDASIDWEGISGLVKITIYRIIQEAVFNVNKYAEAEGCTILLTQNSDSRIQLVIEDNGKGFDTASNVHAGIGLKNIKERAALVKALLVIDSELGRGTMIQVVFADDLK
jgi:signal transduction histidine kinase